MSLSLSLCLNCTSRVWLVRGVIASAGASLHCNCHCGGQGHRPGQYSYTATATEQQWIDQWSVPGPRPGVSFGLHCAACLHGGILAWEGRRRRCVLCDPWKKAGTGTKAAFPPIKSSSAAPNSNRATRRRRQSRRHAGCRGDSASTGDAVRDREVFRLQWCFSTREEEGTGSVFSNPSHTPLPWFCGHFPPGPRPQLFHVTGKLKEEEEGTGQESVLRISAGNWEKGGGKVYIFFVCLLFLTGL
jgi:hypothetical protein